MGQQKGASVGYGRKGKGGEYSNHILVGKTSKKKDKQHYMILWEVARGD